MAPFLQMWAEADENCRRVMEPFLEMTSQVRENFRRAQLLERAGWLPHVTTPFQMIKTFEGEAAEFSPLVESYYRDNWKEVREILVARITSYQIDEEAKAAFDEALNAHEHGLYRAVCRLLLPEIERVARVELNGGALGDVLDASGKRMPLLAYLQEVVGNELSLSEMEPNGFFALQLFGRLTEHLYIRVRDEEQVRRMEADTVPNRHAAIHGLVVYRTFKSSVNTIFMTDYIFQMISLIKAQAA